MQVLEETVRDLVGPGRATRAALLPFGREHEVADNELATPLKQVEQAGLPVRTLEDVLLLDPDHRQPAALSVQFVPLPGEFFLPGQQFLAGSKPLVSGHYLRKIHRSLSFL